MQPPSFQSIQATETLEETLPKKRRIIVTPWQNIAEFEEVRGHIYGLNSNSNTWRRAIVELKIWINRRRSQCPAAVFATLTMLEAKLHEENKHLGESELQSLYAFAIIRFFNFMSSTIQTHNMRSMYNTAIEMGLASFVLDLRHICAHGTELPELRLLRQTINYCLNWLYGYYWAVHTQNMMDADIKCLQERDKILTQQAQQIDELFIVFDAAFECDLNAITTIKDIKKRLKGQRLAKFKAYWKAKNIDNVKETFDAVIADMIALTKCGISKKNLASLFAKSFVKMNYFFGFVAHHSLEHELTDILGVTQNLFRFLAVHNIIETVFKQLFEFAEHAKTPIVERNGAVFWLNQILTGFSVFVECKKQYAILYNDETRSKFDYSALNVDKLSKKVCQTYEKCGIDLRRTIIFGDCFQRPWVWSFTRIYLQKRVKAINAQTATVLPSLFKLIKPKLTSEEVEKLNKIISIYLAEDDVKSTSENMTESESSDKIFTVKDVFDEDSSIGENIVFVGDSSGSDQANNWKTVEDDGYDWSNCPIGRLPWD